VWPHYDGEGRPWLLVSLDWVKGRSIAATPRLDFAGDSIVGGYSPANLNWDDGVPAAEAGIDPSEPGGIHRVGNAEQLASAAIAWFQDRADRWEFELKPPGQIESQAGAR
jgi:hypothetical protein